MKGRKEIEFVYATEMGQGMFYTKNCLKLDVGALQRLDSMEKKKMQLSIIKLTLTSTSLIRPENVL